MIVLTCTVTGTRSYVAAYLVALVEPSHEGSVVWFVGSVGGRSSVSVSESACEIAAAVDEALGGGR